MRRAHQNRRFAGRQGRIGCFGKLAIVIIAVVAAVVIRGWVKDWSDAREERRQIQNIEGAEQELREFAADHLPALQRVIYDFESEIERREVMLERLRADMSRLNREPGDDPDYRRWSEAVERMRLELRQLREKRTDAYLAFRKFELNPDSSDDAEARNRRFQSAQSAAVEGRETFERLIREAEADQE